MTSLLFSGSAFSPLAPDQVPLLNSRFLSPTPYLAVFLTDRGLNSTNGIPSISTLLTTVCFHLMSPQVTCQQGKDMGWKTAFSGLGQRINIFSFADHEVTAATTQLCHRSMNSTQMNVHGGVPIKLIYEGRLAVAHRP